MTHLTSSASCYRTDSVRLIPTKEVCFTEDFCLRLVRGSADPGADGAVEYTRWPVPTGGRGNNRGVGDESESNPAGCRQWTTAAPRHSTRTCRKSSVVTCTGRIGCANQTYRLVFYTLNKLNSNLSRKTSM